MLPVGEGARKQLWIARTESRNPIVLQLDKTCDWKREEERRKEDTVSDVRIERSLSQ